MTYTVIFISQQYLCKCGNAKAAKDGRRDCLKMESYWSLRYERPIGEHPKTDDLSSPHRCRWGWHGDSSRTSFSCSFSLFRAPWLPVPSPLLMHLRLPRPPPSASSLTLRVACARRGRPRAAVECNIAATLKASLWVCSVLSTVAANSKWPPNATFSSPRSFLVLLDYTLSGAGYHRRACPPLLHLQSMCSTLQ